MRKNVDVFIQEHSHINYCEAVIDKEGMVQYVKPSHLQTMINISGKSQDEIWDLMPTTAMPLKWLVNYTNCICVWSGGYMLNNCTVEQVASLKKLIDAKLVDNYLMKY